MHIHTITSWCQFCNICVTFNLRLQVCNDPGGLLENISGVAGLMAGLDDLDLDMDLSESEED